MPRPRGAQPGNHNALKHGFYARQLKGIDLKGLDPYAPLSLDEDIAILRVYIRRLLDSAREPLPCPTPSPSPASSAWPSTASPAWSAPNTSSPAPKTPWAASSRKP